MRGVLSIFASDRFLKDAVLKYVDIHSESIQWDQIFKVSFSSGHKAAVEIAYLIWTDEIPENANPFAAALTMDCETQEACLRALALRWGISS